MIELLRIAWRNIWRTRRRTLISMSVVGFGLFVSIFGLSTLDSLVGSAQDDLDPTGRGHMEVFADGYRLKREVGLTIPDPAEVAATIEARVPEGSDVGWRVVSRGVLTGAWGSRGVNLWGVDPEQEPRLSDFFTAIRDGEVLKPGDDRGIVIGDTLARKVKLGVGDKLTLMASDKDGEVTAQLFRVRGIFHAISPGANLGTVFVTREAAQRLLGLGDVAHEIIVQLPKANLAEPLAAQLRGDLGGGLQVLSLAQLNPGLEAIDDLVTNFMLAVAFAIFLLVGMGILNTLLMSVMERTREWGVMLALGTRPARLLTIVAGEAFWIATLSVVVGFGAGALATWSAARYGWMDFSASGEGFDFAGTAVNSVMRPKLPVASALKITGIVWTMTLLSGLYPAWRASRLNPADSLRDV